MGSTEPVRLKEDMMTHECQSDRIDCMMIVACADERCGATSDAPLHLCDRCKIIDALATLREAAPEMLETLRLIHANAAESPEWIRRHTGPLLSRLEPVAALAVRQ